MEKREQPRLLALRIEQRMKEKKIDILKLADRTGATYEHVRKIVRGASFPSKYFLRIVCEVLTLDFVEMDRLLQVDKLRKQYGFIPQELVERLTETRKVS